MAQFIKNYVQDLAQDIQIRHCGTLIFNTDSDSNVINVSLYNGQEEAPQTGSVVCCVICSDGSTVPVTGGTISGNTVSVTLGADGLIPGQVGIGIQVISGDVKTTVFKAVYSVELFETDTVVDPSSRITISVGELVQDINDAVASIPADYSDLLAAIAPDYTDLTFPITVGTWCWHSGRLYRAKVDIPASETWTAAHWETAPLSNALAGDIQDLKSALDDIGVEEKVSPNLFNPNDVEPGLLSSSSPTVLHTGTYDTDYRTTGFIPVTAGKKYGFHATNNGVIVGIGVSNIWAFDSNETALSGGYLGKINYNTDGLSYITAPEGCAYIRASMQVAVLTNYGTVMISEVDGTTKPSEIVAYGSTYVLNGYADEDEFDAVKDIIDDNFIPDYSPITGTETNGKFIKSDGTVDNAPNNDYVIVEVSATPNATYRISAKAYQKTYYYAFYDSSDNFLSGLKAPDSSGTTSVSDSLATAPATAAKLIAAGGLPTPVIKGVVGYVSKSSKPWDGKKWACVGDSLTEANVATTKHYFEYIAEQSGINTVNMGVGGSGYMKRNNENKAFYQRIANVPTDADVVTIFGSGNDTSIASGAVWETVLGTYTDDTTDTICGCVNATLDAYFAVMPVAPIGIIAPTPWMGYPTTLTTGNRMAEYTEKLRQIAEYRGVPFLDLYHHSNLRPENEANRDECFYDGNPLDGNGDGVHPNALGHEIIAPKIYEFVKTLLIN